MRWVLGAAVLAVAGVGGLWLAWRWHESRLAVQARQCEEQARGLRAEGRGWARALAEGRAQGVFRAFAAGIHAAVLADRKESLEVSIEELVRLAGVVSVHLLRPDGTVVASSDRKLTITGTAGARAAWALAATDFATRAGDLEGTTELALPVKDAAGVRAVLWMTYDTTPILAQARPAAFALRAERGLGR